MSIEEKNYTEKIATHWRENPKTKYIVNSGTLASKEFSTLEEAQEYEDSINASKELRNWGMIEIGEDEWRLIENEEDFLKFSILMRRANYRWTGNSSIPDEIPPKYPILLYHYYDYNDNGPDTNEFRFMDPENLLEKLREMIKNNDF